MATAASIKTRLQSVINALNGISKSPAANLTQALKNVQEILPSQNLTADLYPYVWNSSVLSRPGGSFAALKNGSYQFVCYGFFCMFNRQDIIHVYLARAYVPHGTVTTDAEAKAYFEKLPTASRLVINEMSEKKGVINSIQSIGISIGATSANRYNDLIIYGYCDAQKTSGRAVACKLFQSPLLPEGTT